jgi:hypothetical protein
VTHEVEHAPLLAFGGDVAAGRWRVRWPYGRIAAKGAQGQD